MQGEGEQGALNSHTLDRWQVVTGVGALDLRQTLKEQGLLERFGARAVAWAEQLAVRWIELEGELWTPVFHLEERKGVGKQDFAKNAVLAKSGSRGCSEKKVTLSEGAQRLLKVPGVRRASVPTAFDVEGGYALSCAGAGRPDDILGLVRDQWQGWPVLTSQFLLANVPLALAYLQHGCSDVAKATRDLTIGTTIDVGKVAAGRESAPLAVKEIGGQVDALLIQAMALIRAQAEQAKFAASRAEDKVDELSPRVDQVESDVQRLGQMLQLARKPVRPARSSLAERFKTQMKSVVMVKYENCCPCCKTQIRPQDLEFDHWYSRERSDPGNFWAICHSCNNKLGEPVSSASSGEKRKQHERSFHSFQEMLNLPEMIQCTFELN